MGNAGGLNTPALSIADVARAAQLLDQARREAAPVTTLSQRWPLMDESDAYAIASAGVALAAQPVVGFKLGYTSEAMRRQMNVHQPNYGRLYTGTRILDGGRLDTDRLIHPLLEPEIAVQLGRDVTPGERSFETIAAAVDAVLPALEIVDTRYETYTFAAVDNIADNSSAARFVLGSPKTLASLGDLRSLPATLFADEREIASGLGSDALGDPLRALMWLVDRCAHNGITLPAGTIVLTGGLTRAQPIRAASQFRATFGPLGHVSLLS
jgi:2-keto-4-pentenoate hydratase